MLPLNFYQSEDVVLIAQNLLGKVIVTQFKQGKTSAKIVETEAYKGPFDKASHAFKGRYTKRTATMYCKGGVIYVYLCYGIHHLLNIVTGPENVPHAVLIRAVEPLEGIDIMCKRRNLAKISRNLTAGPGLLTQALGIRTSHDGLPLCESIWIENGDTLGAQEIVASKRVGIAYAQEHQFLPWRFRIKNNPWVSPAK